MTRIHDVLLRVLLAASLIGLGAPVAAHDGIVRAGPGEGAQAFDLGNDFGCAVRDTGALHCWGKGTQTTLLPPALQDVSGVSAGDDHACAIRGDGMLACWGTPASVGTVPAGPFHAVSAGQGSTCGLRSTGALSCWNGDLATSAPAGRFLAVSLGDGHGCAIRSDGTLACWDAPGAQSLGDPPSGRFIAVATGAQHACALGADGALSCWGDDALGQATPPSGVRFLAVGVGESHTCALAVDRTLRCWGDNAAGQAEAIAGTFDQLSVGRQHACARASEGGVRCWGSNAHGQADNHAGVDAIHAGPDLACGLTSDGLAVCTNPASALAPPAGRYRHLSFGPTSACGVSLDRRLICWGNPLGPTPEGFFDRVAVGTDHACAVMGDGSFGDQVICWGGNGSGQASPPVGTFRTIVAGDGFSCALAPGGGRATCWGQGAAVTAVPTERYFYSLVANGGNVCGVALYSMIACWGRDAAGMTTGYDSRRDVAVGARHACVITMSGGVICYGDNSAGQSQPPTQSDFSRITAFGDTTCAQRSGSIVCWGAHPATRPATGVRARSRAITAAAVHTCTVRDGRGVGCWGDNASGRFPPGAFLAEQVAAGNAHSCGIDSEGATRCWGDAHQGALAVPAAVLRSLDAGDFNNCAVAAEGAAVCWGWNANGQGDAPQGAFRALSTGLNHTCGVRDDGTLTCWGYGADGQLDTPSGLFREVHAGERHGCALSEQGALACWGLDSEAQSSPPSGDGHRSLSVGAFHGCALRADGSIVCWGRNTDGQATPPEGSGFVSLAAGAAHTCAISGDGSRLCWGNNASGQAPKPTVFPEALASIYENSTFDIRLSMQAQGYAPRDVEWRLVSGSLPGNTRLEPWGRVVGAPRGVGTHHFVIEARDGNGLVARHDYAWTILRRPDTTPPMVQASPVGPFDNGWFTGNVDMRWTVSDPESPVTSTSGCAPSLVTVDTQGTTFTCSATSEGGTATVTYILKRDATPPALRLVEAPPSPNYGVQPQRFVIEVIDANLGNNVVECTRFPEDPRNFGPCPSPYTFQPGFTYPDYATIPGTLSLAFRSRDMAGNISTPLVYTWTIEADTTPVTIVPEVSGLQGENGWYVSDVSLHWRVEDPETPFVLLETCADQVWRYDGSNYNSCTARSWGGRTQKHLSLLRDTTRPNIYPAPQSQPNAAGWHRAPVQVLYLCEDAASGVASCPTVIWLQTEGASVSTGPQTARDVAGWASLPNTYTTRIDMTAPQIGVAPTTAANANGWYRTNVLMRYTCTDALSGIAACPADDLLTAEGSGVSTPVRTLFDVAGNSSSVSGSVRIDKTAPWITAAATAQPNAYGWYRQNVTVMFPCGDALSGLADPCPANEVLSQEGRNTASVARTVADLAGNETTSGVVVVNIDKTPPTLSVTMPPVQIVFRATHDFALSASDALSGMASMGCTGFTTTMLGTRTVTCIATDRAGNTTSRSSVYEVVKPRITGGPSLPEQRPVPVQRPVPGRPVPGALRPTTPRPRAVR